VTGRVPAPDRLVPAAATGHGNAGRVSARYGEQVVVIGVNPDSRARTVADATKVRRLEAGYLQDDKVIAAITDVLVSADVRDVSADVSRMCVE
jgi:hypothetical protein